jgi:kynureninase
MMRFENTLRFARQLDREDPLKKFRSRFYFPKINNSTALYFIGNSLGLEPKTTRSFIEQELDDWAKLGGEGHEHARRPWMYYHKLAKKTLAKIVGAKPLEVVAMNQLTVNLHLLMITFFTPTKERFKILTEAGAFSSDQYAFETQLKFYGLAPEEALIELKPRPGEYTLRTEDILNAIEEHGSSIALVIFGGVQYYTGQFFDVKSITEAGHRVGAKVAFDMAHAVGNVPLQLHDHDVDFAVWCSYKYLNSGPGAIAGAFIHERYANDKTLPRLAGWWGHREDERFQMKKGFIASPGVDGWQLSNVPIFQGAAHLASLEIFAEAGMQALRKKSLQLTGYLEFLLKGIDPEEKLYKIITPAEPAARGCQLSVLIKNKGKLLFNKLKKEGVVVDWREPDVIRVAPVPLYNTFEEVYLFARILERNIRS